eukprot:m.225192 g.225192  ORF g.225192 m.225192 type:complete len:622 (+) comp11227_c0_seq1:40-1905(+)
MASISAVCQQYIKDYCKAYPEGDVDRVQKLLGEIVLKFKQLDNDGSGDLDLSEIKKLFSESGKSEDEVKDILSQVDDDNSGTLRLREFINFWLIKEKVIPGPIPDVAPIKVFAGGRRRGAMKKKKRGFLKLKAELRKAAKGDGFELAVDIIEAKDLLPMDLNGLADPYVKMYVLPDDRKKTKRKTKILKCTLEPEWKESFVWQLPANISMTNRLVISIYDWDRLTQNDFMGRMAFTLAELGKGGVTGWYTLLDETQGGLTNFRSREQDPSTMQSAVHSRKPSAPNVSEGRREADFQYLKVLGRGNFGKVMLAEHKTTKELVAIKVLKKGAVLEENDIESILTEKSVLSQATGCPFLAHISATFQTKANLFFVMELYTGGDLMFQVLKAQKLSEAATAFYTAEICCGLWYLHSKNIFYRDLKLDNVMLDSQGHVHIADFGLCKDLSDQPEKTQTSTFCGTPCYLAPEVVKGLAYGKEIDFWSLGVMVYEMITGTVLFESEDEDMLYKKIQEQEIRISRGVSAKARTIMAGFLQRDPVKRLGYGPKGADAIRAQPFFEFEWAKLEGRLVAPPIVPASGNEKDALNFDSEFTSEEAVVTPTHPAVVNGYNQEVFAGFSYTAIMQ